MRLHVRFQAIALAWGCLGPTAERGIAGEPPSKPGMSSGDSKDRDGFRRVVIPFLARHCASCHGPTRPKAGLNVESLRDEGTLQGAHRRLRDH